MHTDFTESAILEQVIQQVAAEFEQAGVFFGHGTDNASDEALALALHCMQLDFNAPADILQQAVEPSALECIRQLARQRIQERRPLAYLTGESYFAGLKFLVNENVLIPRSPIAELIQDQYFPWVDPEKVHNMLDLCCGSGCIGIASALYCPDWHVTLADISPQALQVARDNSLLHGLEKDIEIIQSDLLNDIPGAYDLIVCNPPYVSSSEYRDLPGEYRHEPRIGLESGTDGMDIVSQLLRGVASYLKPDGVMIVEVGASAELLMARYPGAAFAWIDFEHGGDGVFMITRQQLQEYQF